VLEKGVAFGYLTSSTLLSAVAGILKINPFNFPSNAKKQDPYDPYVGLGSSFSSLRIAVS